MLDSWVIKSQFDHGDWELILNYIRSLQMYRMFDNNVFFLAFVSVARYWQQTVSCLLILKSASPNYFWKEDPVEFIYGVNIAYETTKRKA